MEVAPRYTLLTLSTLLTLFTLFTLLTWLTLSTWFTIYNLMQRPQRCFCDFHVKYVD